MCPQILEKEQVGWNSTGGGDFMLLQLLVYIYKD